MTHVTDHPSPPSADLDTRATRGPTSGVRSLLLRRLSPRWAFFAFAVLALLAFTLWLRYTAPTPSPVAAAPEPRPNSVAILPFVNAAPDSDGEYFSDGITEELTATLGRVPGLRVAAPASAFAVQRSGGDPQDAGRRLGVGTVLGLVSLSLAVLLGDVGATVLVTASAMRLARSPKRPTLL